MKCPYCGYQESKVVDSRHSRTVRASAEGASACRARSDLPRMRPSSACPLSSSSATARVRRLTVTKSSTACSARAKKRPVALAKLEEATDAIEQIIQNSLDREVSTTQIGELVMERLKPLDEVAYVRFASVYRQFKDIDSFMHELNKLLDEK